MEALEAVSDLALKLVADVRELCNAFAQGILASDMKSDDTDFMREALEAGEKCLTQVRKRVRSSRTTNVCEVSNGRGIGDAQDAAQSARRRKRIYTGAVIQKACNAAAVLAKGTADEWAPAPGHIFAAAYVHMTAAACIEYADAAEAYFVEARDQGDDLKPEEVISRLRFIDIQHATRSERLRAACEAYVSAPGQSAVEKLSRLDEDALLALRQAVDVLAQARGVDLAALSREPPSSDSEQTAGGLSRGSSAQSIASRSVSDEQVINRSLQIRLVGTLLGVVSCGVSMLALPGLLPSLWLSMSAYWATVAMASVGGGLLAYRALSPRADATEASSHPMWRMAGIMVGLCVLVGVSYALSHVLLPSVLHGIFHVALTGGAGVWWSMGATGLCVVGPVLCWPQRGAGDTSRQLDDASSTNHHSGK